MVPKETTNQPDDPIEAALAEFRETWSAGKRPDPDRFCQDHPECGPELREKIDDFLYVAEDFCDASGDSGGDEDIEEGEELPSGKVLGDFRIIREIGRGGMGVVYEAEQISLNRKVALKVLPPHLSFSEEGFEKAVVKFRREAEAAGRQSHPGIVAIYAVGEHKGVHYIAQELVEGGKTLADFLFEFRQKPELSSSYYREVAELFAEIADAFQHAHDSGVAHRDVKPSNILLTPRGTPKVTDFGLAKVEDALALSRTGDFAGTPFYMSPEQAMSKRIGIDHRTDIFSLGATFYEALTFTRAFDGDTSQQVLEKITLFDPPDPFIGLPLS